MKPLFSKTILKHQHFVPAQSSIINLIFLCISFLIFATKSTLISSPIQTPSRLLQQVQQQNQNLLRIDTALGLSSGVFSCINFSGSLCIQCRQGFTLTNGKCYQTIPHCLIQYTNICSTCTTNFRPISSLLDVSGQASTLVVTCVPISTPIINSSTTNNSNPSVNPLTLLGRETFIRWKSIQVRFPTDVYLVMIWNFLNGNEDMRVKVKIQDSILTSAVQGRVRNPTDRLTLVNWVVQNQLVNIVEGLLVDIQNVYFYRLRYRTRSTQIEYEVLTVIHQVNFQITLLQHLLVTSVNGSVLGSSPVINSALNESDSIKAMRQQILDLKMEASEQRQLYKRRQLQFLIFSQYSVIMQSTIQTDPGCIIIKNYLDNKFNDFINMLNISTTPNPGIYAWMNLKINRVYYRKTDPVKREYLYEIGFTDDVSVLVQFMLGRLYEILDVKVVYNR